MFYNKSIVSPPIYNPTKILIFLDFSQFSPAVGLGHFNQTVLPNPAQPALRQ
jgi:hypothetical protein